MAEKRENIYRRQDGRWEGRYIKGYKPTRKPRYGYVYGKDYTTVYEKLEAFKRKFQRPDNAVGFTGMFSDFAIGWLDAAARNDGIKPSTYGSYYRDIHNHIIPDFGADKLPHLLDESDVDEFRNKLKAKGLSADTIARIMRLLYTLIAKARKAGIIVTEIEKKTMPHKRKRRITVLSRAEQAALERVCEGEKTGLLVLLALYTGMRVGEISALQWPDVYLDEGLIYVRETAQRLNKYDNDEDEAKTALTFGLPKSATSERYIAIPPKLIAYLQKAKDKADCEYVISCKRHIAEPRVCQYRFERLLQKADIQKTGFHSLRHTYATRCMESGMDVKTLAAQMGHSKVEMTLKYGDALMEHKKTAVAVLDNVCQIAG